MMRDLPASAPHGILLQVEVKFSPAWLDAVHLDLARDTAESAFLELCVGRLQPLEIASAALDLIIDHATAIMRDVYAAIGLTDQDAIDRGRAIMQEGFADRFDELADQADAAGRGWC